jgi:hypothetical protein
MTALRQIWDCPEAAKKKQLLSACSKSYLYYFVLIYLFSSPRQNKATPTPLRFGVSLRLGLRTILGV